MTDMVVTPFGEGNVEIKNNKATLEFKGTMAEEALLWAIASGPAERESFTGVIKQAT